MKKLSISLRPVSSLKSRKKVTLNRQQHRSTPLHTLIGTVKRHADGFGFFIPEDLSHPDVYLPKKQMEGLMNNDKVKIAVFSRKYRKGLFSGKILQLVERTQNYIVGQYQPLSNKTGIITDDSFQWGEDLKIQLNKNQKIKKGEWVQVKIIHWPNSSQGFSGEVICSLGFFPKATEDNIRVVQKHNIPASFSINCSKEAEAISESIPKDIISQRKDFRSLPFVTIDGKTAQDFDDAIYVSSHSMGWRLYVAIADVSYYVKPGSAMDKEAYQKGNSTYFPGFTLPMLPDKLSNHLCSLKPNEDRLTFVAEIHFNQFGEKEKTKFYEAVIHSQARLNYGEAQDIIEQNESQNSPIFTNVLNAAELARHLLEQRLKKHFINLDIPETEVKLNSLGEPVDISQSRRLFSHQLIEELMLAANKAVAKYLQSNKIPSLYRIHDPPKAQSLKFLESFTQNIGGKTILTNPDLQKKISFLIKQFSDHSLSEVVQTLVLRSLSQAVYSFSNKKHFGLNTTYYTHFTSPIRRYSDLVVHRILKALLTKQTPPYKKQDLESIATMISACEQRSVKAERQLKDIKKARFIRKHLGEEMEGIVCGITNFGLFVKLRLYDIEGLIHINRLNGKWKFEESLLELKSKHSGNRFKMGDFVVIQVLASNIDTGQIDFELKKHKKEKIKIKTTKQQEETKLPFSSSFISPSLSISNKKTKNKKKGKRSRGRAKSIRKKEPNRTKKRRKKKIH